MNILQDHAFNYKTCFVLGDPQEEPSLTSPMVGKRSQPPQSSEQLESPTSEASAKKAKVAPVTSSPETSPGSSSDSGKTPSELAVETKSLETKPNTPLFPLGGMTHRQAGVEFKHTNIHIPNHLG